MARLQTPPGGLPLGGQPAPTATGRGLEHTLDLRKNHRQNLQGPGPSPALPTQPLQAGRRPCRSLVGAGSHLPPQGSLYGEGFSHPRPPAQEARKQPGKDKPGRPRDIPWADRHARALRVAPRPAPPPTVLGPGLSPRGDRNPSRRHSGERHPARPGLKESALVQRLQGDLFWGKENPFPGRNPGTPEMRVLASGYSAGGNGTGAECPALSAGDRVSRKHGMQAQVTNGLRKLQEQPNR